MPRVFRSGHLRQKSKYSPRYVSPRFVKGLHTIFTSIFLPYDNAIDQNSYLMFVDRGRSTYLLFAHYAKVSGAGRDGDGKKFAR